MLQPAYAGPNWARRYGPHSARLCARPGCSTPAAATLRFQPTDREACIVDLDTGAARAGDLCARHASVVALPRGWRVCDERARRAVIVLGETGRPRPSDPAPTAANDLTTLLDASTPLLRRAFGSAFPGANIRE
ncbi:MAG: DUF3499 family protein [Actinomycetota bacterium]